MCRCSLQTVGKGGAVAWGERGSGVELHSRNGQSFLSVAILV